MSYRMTLTRLALSWSTSRGQDTYGYNIARLDDTDRGQRFKCLGGGYDMTGTVFGNWLQATYQDRLKGIAHLAGHIYNAGEGHHKNTNPDAALYGMTVFNKKVDGGPAGPLYALDKVSLDGACGLSTMIAIAEAIGLSVQTTYTRKGRTDGFIVEDTQARVYDAPAAPLAGSKGAA